MARQCPYCRQGDLADDAVKCWHCGSWLDPDTRPDEAESFRRDLRAEVAGDLEKHRAALSSDLDKHQRHIEKLLTRMQMFAGLIAVIAGGFAVYFTGITRETISETRERIEQDARLQVQAAADQAVRQADETVRTRVSGAIRERLDAPETEALIETTLRDSVTGAVEEAVEGRLETIRADVAARIGAAQGELDALTDQIGAVSDEARAALENAQATLVETETAVAGVRDIKASFASARVLDIAGSEAVLDFRSVSGGAKEGLDTLQELVDARINALTFVLGDGGYWGPVIWKYMDRLGREPQFRYAVLQEPGGRVLGYWAAPGLIAALNPPGNADLAAQLGDDPFAIPNDQDIPEWERFAALLNEGAFGELAGLSGFRPVSEPIPVFWSNFQALDHMVRLGVEELPVVDEAGALVGFAERSRLTTRMLLEIAAQPD